MTSYFAPEPTQATIPNAAQIPAQGIRGVDLDGQWELLDVGPLDLREPVESTPEPPPSPLQRELAIVDDLAKTMRRSEQRSLAELTPHAWTQWSTRREDPEFKHPSELDFLREENDAELAKRIGLLRWRKARGLSPLDEAAIREWRARALSYRDLFGCDDLPRVPAVVAEQLPRRSGWAARIVVGMLVRAMVLRRNGVSLSAPEARSLFDVPSSTWWRTISKLESEGWIDRVGMPKDNGERVGAAPVQCDTNCYVPGARLLALADTVREVGAPRRRSDAAARVHHELVSSRRARRRRERTRVRDRNRERRGLPPRRFEVDRAADQLAAATARQHERAAEHRALGRARAILGGARFELDERGPELVPTISEELAAELEARARARENPPQLPSHHGMGSPKGELSEEDWFSRARARASSSAASSSEIVGTSSGPRSSSSVDDGDRSTAHAVGSPLPATEHPAPSPAVEHDHAGPCAAQRPPAAPVPRPSNPSCRRATGFEPASRKLTWQIAAAEAARAFGFGALELDVDRRAAARLVDVDQRPDVRSNPPYLSSMAGRRAAPLVTEAKDGGGAAAHNGYQAALDSLQREHERGLPLFDHDTSTTRTVAGEREQSIVTPRRR